MLVLSLILLFFFFLLVQLARLFNSIALTMVYSEKLNQAEIRTLQTLKKGFIYIFDPELYCKFYKEEIKQVKTCS